MSLNVQFLTMLAMIGMGGYLGATLDTYNRFLKRSKRNRWFVFVYDFSFWILQALLIFYVLLLVNEAELRFYIFIAILCGYAAYQSLFRSIYLKALEHFIRLVITCYRFLFNAVMMIIVKPFLLLVKGIMMVLLFFVQVVQKIFDMCMRIVLGILSFIGRILWMFIPKKGKLFLQKHAGIFKKAKNIVIVIKKWWGKFKK
ncbi:spore cortex biosynthesis protein YabQ [Priestia taiwanensis]|uniref:Spore cortex biosynthesis protein YabQ n=1 Tax=Priestia taiwanensis TaxID=1347902 RepID=A0A917AZA1_9BACI|nr:spore cortex biosynthesis protein YabQ [Priestia taiwanensis]MBM7365171.1 spore cortex biosynthesis protein YabQ [Priestia taiwanensis]GGE84715.1 spore cortex biosynthesis protein YabQ [Priestia taiwanensis]